MWEMLGQIVLVVYFFYSLVLMICQRDEYIPEVIDAVKERPIWGSIRCLIILAFFFIFGPIIDNIR